MNQNSFKYTVTINIKALIDSELDLDYIDLVVFEAIKDSAPVSDKLIDGKTVYFKMRADFLIQQLPKLGITTSRGMWKRIENLIREGVFVRYDKNKSVKEQYLTYGENYERLIYSTLKNDRTMNESSELNNLTMNESSELTMNESSEYNIINNNNIINIPSKEGVEAEKSARLSEKRDIKRKEVKKEPTLIGQARPIFELYYQQMTGAKYYWEAKDAANMKRLLAKIKFTLEDYNTQADDENILVSLKTFLSHIRNEWIIGNLSVSKINSQYNELIANIKNGREHLKNMERESAARYAAQRVYELTHGTNTGGGDVPEPDII